MTKLLTRSGSGRVLSAGAFPVIVAAFLSMGAPRSEASPVPSCPMPVQAAAAPGAVLVGTPVLETFEFLCLAPGDQITGVLLAWGDGKSSPASSVSYSQSWFDLQPSNGGPPVQIGAENATATGTHTYERLGLQAPSATATDEPGGQTVGGGGPSLLVVPHDRGHGVAVTPAVAVPFSGVVAEFTVPDYVNSPTNRFSATMNWGDGTKSTGTLTALPTPSSLVSAGDYSKYVLLTIRVHGRHRYRTRQRRTITITITDSLGHQTLVEHTNASVS